MKAIYDEELTEYLSSLGILRDVESGKLNCHICSKEITIGNLQAVFPHSGQIKVVCDAPNCMKQLAESLT